MQAPAHTSSRSNRTIFLVIIAASAAVLLLVGVFLWQYTRPAYQTVATKNNLTWAGLEPFQRDLPESVTPAWTSRRAAGDNFNENTVHVDVILDMECPYCQKEILAVLPKLLEDPRVEITLFDMPLEKHPLAAEASGYSRCVAQKDPDQYLPYMMAAVESGNLDSTSLEMLTLDMKIFTADEQTDLRACVAVETLRAKENTTGLVEVGIKSTPTLIINGRILRGYLEWPYLQRLIEEAKIKLTHG